ncbi:MAG: ABC transporter ATP-binding protein/permease [Acholeplasmatales bacterium]|nr:ABC transporter ATP-binding protein/permease [Acholeplasmatales bacterium]
MIKVEHLNKTYNLNKKNSTHAVKDISFTLPDSGMIFIVGKSGSGKSTILNILGGLDDFESGSVIVDGNDLSKMKHSDYNKYRSTYVSFIFQDHFLIDDYNVKDNVMLSLNILNENNEDKVKEVLRKVELEDKIDSFPLELSGGQRQRVAVARAIIKDPKLILCDEPTGNLDTKTTLLIFDLLKELSKTKLVIVVSHDLDNAKIYADRIIEIFDGKVLTDKVKNAYYSDKLSVMNDVISIPDEKILSKEDYDYINKHINENTKLEVGSLKYIDTDNVRESNRVVKLEKKKFYKKGVDHLSRLFIKKRLKKMFLTSLIVALIISCFSIFLSLLSFDGNREIINKLKKSGNSEVLIRSNCYIDADEDSAIKYQNKMYSVLPEDEKYFKEHYDGELYKLYNVSLGYSSSNSIRNENYNLPERNLVNFYIKESYGTLCCNKEYLEKKFGTLKAIKGDINDTKGLIITDYLADSLIYHNLYRNSYDEIIGKYYLNTTTYDWFYVSAIIETDYKEKFKDIMDKYDFNDRSKNDLTKVISSDEFDKFAYEIKMKYGLAYSFSKDFLNDYINEECIGYIPFRYSHLEYDGQDYYMEQNASVCVLPDRDLHPGEVIANLKYFNRIFGTNLTEDDIADFKPMKIKFKKYYDYTTKRSDLVLAEVEVTIVAIENRPNSNHDFYCLLEDYSRYKDISAIQYGYILDNVDSAIKALKKKDVNNFIVDDNSVKTITLITKYVQVFKKLSILISVVLGLIGLIYLVFYEVSNISSMKKEIGILKACGARQRTISKIFIYQQFIVCLMVVILSMILSYFLIMFANSLMITSIDKYAHVFINGLDIIRFIPLDIVTILVLTIIIIMASCTIPILLLIKVKPMNIIKAKE